jgi:hypothetical protein
MNSIYLSLAIVPCRRFLRRIHGVRHQPSLVTPPAIARFVLFPGSQNRLPDTLGRLGMTATLDHSVSEPVCILLIDDAGALPRTRLQDFRAQECIVAGCRVS